MKLIIPEQFKKLVCSTEIDGKGNTVEEIIKNLIQEFPDLKSRILTDRGEFNRFINIYINEEDIRFLDGKSTKVKSDDTVTLLPAISGG